MGRGYQCVYPPSPIVPISDEGLWKRHLSERLIRFEARVASWVLFVQDDVRRRMIQGGASNLKF